MSSRTFRREAITGDLPGSRVQEVSGRRGEKNAREAAQTLYVSRLLLRDQALDVRLGIGCALSELVVDLRRGNA